MPFSACFSCIHTACALLAALGLCSAQAAGVGWSPAGDEGSGGQGMDPWLLGQQ